MRINTLTGALLIGALAPVLASCGNDDEPKVDPDRGQATTVVSPSGFSFVAPDDMPAQGFTTSATAYSVDYYENRTADIHIAGLTLTQGSAPMSVDITAVPYRVLPSGAYQIDASNITADGGTMRFSEIELISAAVTTASGEEAGIFTFSAETADKVCVTYIPSEIVCGGRTVITSPTAGSFNTTETSYLISFVSPAKASVTVRNARFAQSMPSVGDMQFDNIDVTFDDRGGYKLSAATIIPTISGVPYPSFAITGFSADVDLETDNDVDITFSCNVFGQNHTVTADDLGYYIPASAR